MQPTGRGGTVRRSSPLAQPSAKATKKRVKEEREVQKRTGEERQYLDPQELAAFFKYIPTTNSWYPYFYIQFFYGCRLSEPALVLDEDVSTKKKLIVIKRLKKAQESEGFREHVYVADPRILECVNVAKRWKQHKGMEENPFLFASNRRRENADVGAERLSQLRNHDGWQAVSRFTAHRMFQRIAAAVKIPQHLRHAHVLRHTRAVLMLATGSTPETVQHLLGHSSVKMTQRYNDAAREMRLKMNDNVMRTLNDMGLMI